MNPQSNAAPEWWLQSGFAKKMVAASRPLYWSIRREVWENRSIYLAPIAAAVIFLFGFAVRLHVRVHGEAFWDQYEVAPVLIMGSAIIVSVFYCVDALYGERRDRSILFWKSLPVSDVTTVISKLSIPVLVLPLVSFVITVATLLLSLMMSSAILAGSGGSVRELWTHVSLFRMPAIWLYHLVTVHGIWYAPFYAWFLLVSAWAPRAPFLWAALPPFVIYGVERVAFNTSYFLDMLKYRFLGPGSGMATEHHQDLASTLIPHHFLSTPGLWTGLAVAAIFLFATLQLRRSRGPI
jgi:ABC-2 type transport system permease protein